jgi:DNA-binding Xre family transcriptional regulator
LRMRLRIRELLAARDMTAHALAKASGGRIPVTTAYRMVAADGRLSTLKATVLDALCGVLGVDPGALFEVQARRGKGRGGRHAK